MGGLKYYKDNSITNLYKKNNGSHSSKEFFKYDQYIMNCIKRCLISAPRQFEPRCEETGPQGFGPDPTETGLYSHRRWLEA